MYLDRDLQFDWLTYIFPSGGRPAKFVDTHISFELIFIMHLKSTLHMKAAKTIIDADHNAVTEAQKHLAQALSVISYTDTVLISRWMPDNPALERPWETRTEYVGFLAAFFEASAQQMFATKALLTGSSLAGRLCLAVAEKMRAVVVRAPRLGVESFVAHAAIQRDFYYGLSYKLRAEIYLYKTETGMAIACCNFGQVTYFSIFIYFYIIL